MIRAISVDLIKQGRVSPRPMSALCQKRTSVSPKDSGCSWSYLLYCGAHTRKASTTARKPADMFCRLG